VKNNKNIFVIDKGIIFKYALKSQEYDKNLYYEVSLNKSSSDMNSVGDLNYQMNNDKKHKIPNKKFYKIMREFALLKRLSDSKKGNLGVGD
jgi:hypothetical protein